MKIREYYATTRHRHLIGRFASMGLAFVLCALTGLVFWALLTAQHLTMKAHTATRLNDCYQNARYAVGAEESLERKYRLEPSPEVFTSHRKAARDLEASLGLAAKVGGVHDRAIVGTLLKEHEAYLATTIQMFAAVDAGQTERVKYIDDNVTDPIFGKFEQTISTEADLNQVKALSAMQQLDVTQRRLAAQTITIFTVGILLLGAFMFMLRNLTTSMLRQTQASLGDAELQLIHSSKLASLGTLSAGIAHELNQPIAIIRGVSQQLQDEPGLSEDVQSDLTLIEGQTSRMVKIINHLRCFSRVGRQELDKISVNSVIQDCLLLIGAQLRTQDIALELDLQEGAPMVLADANQLEQVFLNLITNARDAMEGRAGSRIVVRTFIERGALAVEFRDNGPGIPPSVAERIFDPFFTTKEVGKGTGLGLSISHGIIEKHGGALDVRCDGGAVFKITLPIVTSDCLPKAA